MEPKIIVDLEIEAESNKPKVTLIESELTNKDKLSKYRIMDLMLNKPKEPEKIFHSI